MAKRQELTKLASKYIPNKAVEKKINTFGANTSSQLKSKIDSARNSSNINAEKSRYALNSMAGDQGSNLKKALKASKKYDTMSNDAEYLANRMKKSVGKMIMKESGQAANAQVGKLSVAPTDVTGVSRISVPLAETQFNN
jgi:hypothetical protein